MAEDSGSDGGRGAGVRHFPAAERRFESYEGFDNAYPQGDAFIARLVTPRESARLGCGVARYRRVRTVWTLPIDEVVHVLEGALTVISRGHCFQARAGDVLYFPRGEPVEYDVPDQAVLFYAEHPATGPLSGSGEDVMAARGSDQKPDDSA